MQTCEVLDRESEAVSEAMSQPKLETTILSALKVKLSILDHEGWDPVAPCSYFTTVLSGFPRVKSTLSGRALCPGVSVRREAFGFKL